MLDKAFEYFKNHQKELYEKYPGKYLVIVEEEVVIVAETMGQAYFEAIAKGLDLGKFLIQKCLPGEDAYTEIFHSRVVYV